MKLRYSRREDNWRTTYRRDYSFYVERVECQKDSILNGLIIELKPGISAIAGKNGVGKSSFVRGLFNCFASDNSNRRKFVSGFDKNLWSIIFNYNKNSIPTSINPCQDSDFGKNYPNVISLIYDPCNLIPAVQKMFIEQENLEELIESQSSYEIDKPAIELLNFISNNEYEKVKVISIEDEYDEFPKLPFFIVESKGATYDSRTMGLGELSIFYLFWLINLPIEKHQSVFFIIEEPESFLPPLIQNRLIDILAMQAAEKGVSIFVSTHSEHILNKIPRTHIHFLRKSERSVKSITAAEDRDQLSMLGLNSPKIGMVFIEDEAAKIFFQSTLRKSSKYTIDSFYYHVAGSEGDLIAKINCLPSKVKDFHFIGIFDGDCIGRVEKQIENTKLFSFLPGRNAPEKIAKEALAPSSERNIAGVLGVSEDKIRAALETAAGCDHHDFFLEIANRLCLPYETVLGRFFDMWLDDTRNSSELTAFFSAIESHC